MHWEERNWIIKIITEIILLPNIILLITEIILFPNLKLFFVRSLCKISEKDERKICIILYKAKPISYAGFFDMVKSNHARQPEIRPGL